MRGRVRNRQFLRPLLMVLEVDGSAVSTTESTDGLDRGTHVATIYKGTGADSNLVTITFKRPFGTIPQVVFQEITLDCVCRLEAAATKTGLQVRTLELDGVTKEDDADFQVFLFGSDDGEYVEGKHLST